MGKSAEPLFFGRVGEKPAFCGVLDGIAICRKALDQDGKEPVARKDVPYSSVLGGMGGADKGGMGVRGRWDLRGL